TLLGGQAPADSQSMTTGRPVETVVHAVASRRSPIRLVSSPDQHRYVERVTALLAERGIDVSCHTLALEGLSGDDLRHELDMLYGGPELFCVVLVSRLYAGKVWAGHERVAVHARVLEDHADRVLAVRFDSCTLPGRRDAHY